MNTIHVDNNIINSNVDNSISIKDNICIEVLKNTTLYLEIYNSKDINIKIDVKDNVNFKLFNFSEVNDSSVKFYINQEENSKLVFNSFYKNNNIYEDMIVNLNGINSNIEYNYSCLGNTKKRLRINHNFSNTNSIVKNHAVSNNDIIEFEIIEFVPKNSINCKLSQFSKIINLDNNKSLIKPILLIDEEEVQASHSSIITPINTDDLLYLMSRGIDEDGSTKLLINGFLIDNLSISDKEKHILYEKHVFRR